MDYFQGLPTNTVLNQYAYNIYFQPFYKHKHSCGFLFYIFDIKTVGVFYKSKHNLKRDTFDKLFRTYRIVYNF